MPLQHQGHVRLDLSDRRRLFLASDIHGEYRKLEEALSAQDWDPGRDALIIAGDLADRGPDSEDALEWIDRDGVHRVLGNHDVMPRMYLDGIEDRDTIVSWGGAWFVDLDRQHIRTIADALEDAPVAMTVTTPGGYRIGIVHADCLPSWDSHVRMLSDPREIGHETCVSLSLWSSNTIDDILHSSKRRGCPPGDVPCQVSGIDHVFHGHTIMPSAFAHDNRSWIDTGAYRPGGRLTLIDADAWLDYVDMHRAFR